MKRKVDRKKIMHILSVYLLALAAAVIAGSGHTSKASAQAQTPAQAMEQVTGAAVETANASVK